MTTSKERSAIRGLGLFCFMAAGGSLAGKFGLARMVRGKDQQIHLVGFQEYLSVGFEAHVGKPELPRVAIRKIHPDGTAACIRSGEHTHKVIHEFLAERPRKSVLPKFPALGRELEPSGLERGNHSRSPSFWDGL